MKRSFFAFVFIFLFTVSGSVRSDEFLFVTLEFPPLEYTGEDNRPTGIAVEIVEKVMARLGHEVTIKVLPWARSLDMVRTGQADAIFTAYKTSEREAFLDYSEQILISQVIALYTRADDPWQFDGQLASLKSRRIGVVSTISYGERFDAVRDQLTLHRVAHLEQNFDKLLLDRIDTFVSNFFVGDWELYNQGLTDRIQRLPVVVEEVPSYIAFSKKSALISLRDDFDRVLSELKANGDYDILLKKYGIRQ